MTMTLEEVSDHVVQIRGALALKRHQLPKLLEENPPLAMQVRYQIDCLEPRLDELESQCLRLSEDRTALPPAVLPVYY
jgi:hypothetical protein